ncbi:uncharacterized protein C8Q71DRAFT_797996 [Rhodofomes roseus]|uniref:Uncharacterized protein n=1 Tax=Rhodofomes roseus TaxID=34475 RepID=A0ABQ8KAG3_9APHY|nr:uncharacterized protein C8Q71DRAFT_797996 [Rhodofomes roseus]KAH9834254.1 hypothetical protein C8Q71DRAFT_797996 [Rhodofomes roseus]
MTDFSSQGRTRPYNVVDLQNCKNHQSVYTCLSRGSTYQGTIIVQGFDNSKFMGGVTGWLRQEFRELELLDEITKLKYDGTLSPSVEGVTCVALIHSYRTMKGAKYMPNTMHSALKWSEKQPFDVEKPYKESQWEMVKRANKDKQPQLQRDPDSLAESKEPVCFTWNNETYSCAFDTLFGILHNIYREQNMIWEPDIKSQNAILTSLYQALGTGCNTMEF